MSLDPRFVLAYPFTDYFPDKDTGLPLANGIITFYRDSARTELKNIYTLRGAPPYSTASYVPLPNPMTLSSIGTPQDNDGNNVDIYFFPYEGDPDDESDTLDLYYMTCVSEDVVSQFTRSAIPQLTGQEIPVSENVENFVPNPQFVTHNDGESNGSTADGEIQQPLTNIAPGNWYFQRPNASVATDFVSFYRFGAPITPPPTGNPRFAVEIENTVTSPGDAYKYLILRFPNVSKFASATQTYTLWFEGTSAGVASVTAQVVAIKYYGVGGSPTQTITQGEITFDTSWGAIRSVINFGLNSGATIGPNDDDYIDVAINLPRNVVFKVRATNFILTPGDVAIDEFPITTNAQSLSVSLAGATTPDYEGYDLGLPIVLGRNGYESDQSQVGNVIPVGYSSSKIKWNEKLCDGTGYIYGDYTADGIPLRRLGDVLWDTTTNSFEFGSSPTFASSTIFVYSTSALFLTTNMAGAQAGAADGADPTGFTFASLNTGFSSTFTGYYSLSASSVATIIGNAIGEPNNYPTAGTSGFIVKPVRSESSAYQIFTVETYPGLPAAGTYFTFENSAGAAFYVWFRVNGAGADPAPGGTGILINILSTWNVQDVARAIVAAISGSQTSSIVVAAAPTAGKYFTFSANSVNYLVWYAVNGAGTEPVVANTINIRVDIPTAATVAQVVAATNIAINKYAFAVPDLRGMVPRGLDEFEYWDLHAARRLSRSPNRGGPRIGTIELDSILHHEHATVTGTITGPPLTDYGFSGGNQFESTEANTKYVAPSTMLTIAPGGSTLLDYATINALLNNQGETRGTNMALNWVIKL